MPPRLPSRILPRLGGARRPEEWFLGSLQTLTLRVLTARGPSTVREVMSELPARRRRAYTTVMTVLDKLFQKGLVRRTRVGRGYRYEARYSPEELSSLMAGYLVRELLDDFGDAAIAHFESALDDVGRRKLEAIRGGRKR